MTNYKKAMDVIDKLKARIQQEQQAIEESFIKRNITLKQFCIQT